MTERKYSSQLLYLGKIAFIVILLALGFFLMTVVSHFLAEELSRYFRKNMIFIEYIINGFFGIVLGLAILLVVLRWKPSITLNDYTLKTNRFTIDFDDIASYHPAKGGSEPYVIGKNNQQYDIELSWFSKRNRMEIEKFIQTQLQKRAV